MSNYETTKHLMQAEFLRYDQEAMLRRFHLRHDEDYLYLTCLARPYRIHRRTGLVEWSGDGFATVVEAGFNEAMTIFDLLCHTRPEARLAGEFVSMSQLTRLHSGSHAPGSSIGGAQFDHREAELARACEMLGGAKTTKGDVAYLLPLFDCLPVILRFWSSDEDFPASLQLSWDRNTLDFLHYETVCYASGMLLSRLREVMNASRPELSVSK